MDTDHTPDAELIARLRQLDASAPLGGVGFGYETLIDRHVARLKRARRRHAIARGTAGALVIALIGASVWRIEQPAGTPQAAVITPETEDSTRAPQPRIVRADTYLAVAALEEHIASLD